MRALLGKPPLAETTPRRTRLFTQMLLSFICLTAVTSLIAGMLNVTLVRNYVQDSSMETLLDRAADIAELMQRPGGSLKVINVQQLDEWERLTNAQVILINTDMTLVTRQTLRNRRLTVTVAVEDAEATAAPTAAGSSADADDGAQILSAIDYALVAGVLAGGTVADVRQFDFMEGTWLFAGVPIRSDDGVQGAVLLCQPLSQIDYVAHNISLIMSLAVSISTLFAIMLSLLLTQRIVQPISAMNRTAQRMANGNYGERVTVPGTTEIAQLGESLNLLSGNLYTTIRSLNQEKVKMELVLSGIGEGIIAINQIGKMVHCNDAAVKLLELHNDDAQRDVYALTERSPLIGMLIQVLESGETLNGGWKNGAGQSVAATVSPIRMGEDLVGAVGLVRDVSEAERLEQLRRDYVANISHELRTPLTGIRGMVEPLIDGVYDTEAEKQECYHIIYQETRRLERLITDMLDISRLQDGRIHIDLEEMQVHGILEAAARRLEKRAADEGVRLAVEPGEDPAILGNEDRIMQVLIILIDNALKFTPAGGSVTLRTRTAEGMLWISVRDTGAGIAREDLPYIFERFYKADKSRMETRGTGLGLAIARLVVELMGGTIWCESELGRGSTFEFSVKLAEEPGDADAPDLPGEAGGNGAPAAEPDGPDAPVAPDAEAPVTPVASTAEAPAAPAEPGAEDDEDAQSESVKAQARIREVAASVGVNDENIEFDELLEMLLSSPGDARSPRPSADGGTDDGGKAAENGKDEGAARSAD
ncbi:MAG: ATP-binding protein [Candidatus Fimadaptatus sp.]